jgi:hypothetical protein
MDICSLVANPEFMTLLCDELGFARPIWCLSADGGLMKIHGILLFDIDI